MYDVIVVGSGIAGMTAAIYAQRGGLSVLVLEAYMIGGQIVDSLSVRNYPGFREVTGVELTSEISCQMSKLGVELKYELVMSVKELGKGGFEVETDEAKYKCRAIIIATGTEPRRLSAEQEKDVGERPISYCAACDGALYADRPVVVVGSGNTAKHEIKYLEGICEKVYHIHHDDPIPEDAEAVFVAIGRVPGTDLVKDLVELDSEGYIVAREDCETSRPGVFVAGDCRAKNVRQLVTAAGDGAVAAKAVTDYLSKK